MLNDEIRTIEESYEAGCTASNLKVKTEERGPADILIAAGWAHARLGLALLRLRSEWVSAEKPKHISYSQMRELANKYDLPIKEAQHMTDLWMENELKLLLLKLKTLKDVRRQLDLIAERKGIAREAVGPVILHHLDPTCKPCSGHGKTLIPGTPSLSAHDCQHCRGTGKTKLPYGEAGKYLANAMDASIQSAKYAMKGRFKHHQKTT